MILLRFVGRRFNPVETPRVSPIPSLNRWLTLARPRRCYLLGAPHTIEEEEEEERVTYRDIINS